MSIFTWIRKQLVQPGPADLSNLDHADRTAQYLERMRIAAQHRLQAPEPDTRTILADHLRYLGLVDTDMLRDAISDGDNPALRAEVHVTRSGSMIHGDLGGAL